MPFNDGSALAVGGKIGRGVILSTEGTAMVQSGRREDMVTLASGLSDNFSPINTSVHVLNDVIGGIPVLSLAESFIEGAIPGCLYLNPASVTVENNLFCATSTVWEPNKNYVIPHLYFLSSRNPGATSCVTEAYQYIDAQTEIAVSRRVERPTICDRFSRPASTIVVESEEQKFKINYAESLVVDVSPQGINTTTMLTPAIATIEDYKPPAWGNTGSGSGLKSTRIIAQKGAFFELYLSFDDCKVVDVIGLPQGLTLEGSYIKGSPVLSGKYPVTMKLSNDRTIDVYVIVPEVPRQL